MTNPDSSHDRPAAASGPLTGVRIVEFAAIGPGPFACMMLSDMGADVVTIDRPGRKPGDSTQIVARGRTVVTADLKNSVDRESVLSLLEKADVLIEGYRPGVMERLGLGPTEVARRNPRLVYGRMTGWGQEGPLASSAGHDINFIAITGALHAIGTADSGPVPPLNLVGDYGGGSLYLLVGVLAALHEAQKSGRGQVVDAAITDGVINMMSNCVGRSLRGSFSEQRGENMLDGGHPYYGVYETSDGSHVALGAIEPQFFAEFCRRSGVPEALHDAQHDAARWPQLRDALVRIFKSRTQVEWARQLSGTDACLAPVLPLSEAARHPHNVARHAFVEVGGVAHPAPAPRFSRTPSAIQGAAPIDAVPLVDIAKRWT
ncbi:Formyl-coenzyme A transferase (plasmid) [Variovorax sp. SRS16]|uniref:CaiB/BaiF CoA transferase family protein n=1 Tax=Variovorax sp. SRS16 TaxID=282217 RepID=UPI001317A1C9|nr:CaiB/BaiF CoA-transferase family protein [Variovorax sp. SRS16]VTU45374.1 Formyl-coenzyme A transferase [Variovorax sp. SRS16]